MAFSGNLDYNSEAYQYFPKNKIMCLDLNPDGSFSAVWGLTPHKSFNHLNHLNTILDIKSNVMTFSDIY